MRLPFTNHHRTFGKYRLTKRNNSIRKLIRTIFFLNVFCFISFQSSANWWTEVFHAPTSAGSHFKANFNVSNGTIHIESYAWNGEYLNIACCIFRSMWVESATMAYSTDGINFVDFYWFGFDHGNQTISSQLNGFTTAITSHRLPRVTGF
jgi:hypothetical protein